MPTKLHIAIDGNEANVAFRVGSNVYAHSLLEALYQLRSPDCTYTILLADTPQNHLPSPTSNWQYRTFGPTRWWTQWALPKHLFSSAYTVFFTPSHYAPRFSPIPYISSVMDTSYVTHPTEFRWQDRIQLTSWTQYSVKNAARVLCISQETQKNVQKYYHKPPSETFVAYPGRSMLHPIAVSQLQRWLKKQSATSPYFVHVGTLQPRKRIHHIITAHELLLSELSRPKSGAYRTGKQQLPHLLLLGKVGWLAESITAQISTSRWKSHIHAVGFVTDEEKAAIIKQATALIAMGEGEGFGIPVLESMQLKTIPIVAETGSLPEVIGDAGVLVLPNAPTELAQAMEKVLTLSKTDYKKLAARGVAQSEQFSWEESARIVQEQLLEIAS